MFKHQSDRGNGDMQAEKRDVMRHLPAISIYGCGRQTDFDVMGVCGS